jgi:hypothetical protein
MAEETAPEVSQLHAWIHPISPVIGRRLLIRDESALSELHDVIPVAFGWYRSWSGPACPKVSPRFVLVSYLQSLEETLIKETLPP